MVKVLTFIKRKPGLTVEGFQRYWLTRHPAVVTRLPGVRRYVQSHTLPASYRKGEPAWDGIAEVWADDTDALRAMTRSATNADVQADEAQFIDRTTMGLIVTEDHVVVEGAAGPDAVKAIEFLNRRPGASVDEFQQHWRERHGAILATIPGLRRCVLSATRRSAYAAGRTPTYERRHPDVVRVARGAPHRRRVARLRRGGGRPGGVPGARLAAVHHDP
jgi:uncharacterized protein (TIGR02118 family)